MNTPLFCLTLAEEPWKRAATLAHFHAHSLSPVFVSGFHGMLTGLRPTNPFQLDRDGTPEYIHIQQVGCFLSHMTLLQCALASGAPSFIACEDDVHLADGFAAAWSALEPLVPASIGAVQLEYIPAEFAGKPIPHVPVPGAPGLSTAPAFAHCAACIWWRRSAAQEALRLLRPIDAPYDISLIRKVYPFVGHALCDPPLARQRTAYGQWPSSIGLAAGKPHLAC